MTVSHAAVAALPVSSSRGVSLRRLLRADLSRYREFHRREGRVVGARRLLAESLAFKAGFQAVVLYRVSHWLYGRGCLWLAWTASRCNQLLTGAEIEFGARVGPGLLIPHPAGIVIGRGSRLGRRVTVFQGVTCGVRGWTGEHATAYPRIGDDVVLFARCSVLGGVAVGHRAVVAAHALVTRDVPAGALAEGLPARCRSGRGAALLAQWGRSGPEGSEAREGPRRRGRPGRPGRR